MKRDAKMARDLNRLSFHVARHQEEISRWREGATQNEAHSHYVLYTSIVDELADAVAHLDCAATLMDPVQTDAVKFAEESQ